MRFLLSSLNSLTTTLARRTFAQVHDVYFRFEKPQAPKDTMERNGEFYHDQELGGSHPFSSHVVDYSFFLA
jgi:hypothetical protein